MAKKPPTQGRDMSQVSTRGPHGERNGLTHRRSMSVEETFRVVNLSELPESHLLAWLPTDLSFDTVVFLPDVHPARTPLPTGVVVLTGDPQWHRFAASDYGCGMRLLHSATRHQELTPGVWNALAAELRARSGRIGSLGAGNHFLDALVTDGDEYVYFLLHCGSLRDSDYVSHYCHDLVSLHRVAAQLTHRGRRNRDAIQRTMEKYFGPLKCLTDAIHNSIECRPRSRVIIRNGAVKVRAGDLHVMPSHMFGPVSVLKAKQSVRETLHSLNHGTGKVPGISGQSNRVPAIPEWPPTENVLLPAAGSASRVHDYRPHTYRDLWDCLKAVAKYADLLKTFKVIAHLD